LSVGNTNQHVLEVNGVVSWWVFAVGLL
jgi:hypothetical protein